MQSIYEEQWKRILEHGQKSEEARIRTAEGHSMTISGIFFSGTYSIDKAVPYSAKNGIDQQFFQLSELSLSDNEIADADELKMAEVTISGRGVFRVAIVKGKGSGMLTLYLQPRRG